MSARTDDMETTKAERIRIVVDAIEGFINAKATRERHMAEGENLYSHRTDVDETREHLRDKLAELLS